MVEYHDCENFFVPTFVVKNITSGARSKKVSVLGLLQIDPGETVDLYKVVQPVTDLFEDQIIKGLEKPHGDLYVEVVIKKTLQILACRLSSWHYSIVGPENIQSTNPFTPGQVPSAVDDRNFVWVDPASGLIAEPPLVIDNSVISMPPADATTDGYLTSEDWVRFNNGLKNRQRIWQYQDFSAPASSSLTLTAFQNGTGMTFDSSYIVSGTAEIVLQSDHAKAPTTTDGFPARLLPGNRVEVSSHVGTTVILNQGPAASQNVRVYYLTSIPADVGLPVDYQEDPEFLNDGTSSNLDEFYVNQNQDEIVYGIKTWNDEQRFQDTIQYVPGSADGYILTSDVDGYASWQPSSAIVTDHGSLTGLADDDHPQYFHLSQDETVLGHTTFSPTLGTDPAFTITPDGYVPTTNVSEGSVSVIGGVLYVYDATRAKWLAQSPLEVTAARNQKTSSDIYLRTSDGVSTNIAPFVLPWDVTLTAMTASTDGVASWTAETRVGGVAIAGATLVVTAATSAFDDTKNVDFAQGTAVQLFASGTKIPYPRINLFFARRGT